MRLTVCVWCGKRERKTHRTKGAPGGISPLSHSERWPEIQMHLECAGWMRNRVIRVFGESTAQLPIFEELKPCWGEVNEAK